MNWIKTHKHCLWLLYFCFYFPMFFLLERISAPKYIIECAWDRMIPFCTWFIFPYFLWYITMPGSLLLFMFKDKEAFLRLCFIMFGGMTIALGVYWICPNGVAIRVPVEGSGIAAELCRFLQTIDPPTNVCPSIHVSSSVAIDIAVQGSAMFRKNKPIRILSFIIMLAISASTAFVKQHSLWDIAAGAVMSIGLMLVYDRLIVRKKEKRNAAENISGRA